MTRFKELRRIEKALDARDIDELSWAAGYADSRIRIAPNHKQKSYWQNLRRRVSEAIEGVLSERYTQHLGSDVPNNGMYLELRDEAGEIVASVFRSDSSGAFEVSKGSDTPKGVFDAFVKRAKEALARRSGA